MSKEKNDKNNPIIPENIGELVKSVSGKTDTQMSNDESLKSLELAKIIVKEILNENNILSLSSIKSEQVIDLVHAKLLNSYYQIDEIDDYINNFLLLKRSENALLLHSFEKMIMYKNDENINNPGFFSRILKR